jgi:hypothetical protein
VSHGHYGDDPEDDSYQEDDSHQDEQNHRGSRDYDIGSQVREHDVENSR